MGIIKKEKNVKEPIRLLDENTPFAIKEAFNQLRTNIMYSPNDGDGCPVYGITSAEMGVGKSTISTNIALSFAQAGKNVLIVDADMRRPAQHKAYQIDKTHLGLSELLSEIESDDKNVICHINDSLSLITAGSIPPNPSALMLSKKIGELIDKWRHEYDIVFIDLPPVGLVTDPLTISSHISGYIMVITVDKSESRAINDCIAQIKQVDAQIIGIVVNGAASKSKEYNYTKHKYKYKYYQYQYK